MNKNSQYILVSCLCLSLLSCNIGRTAGVDSSSSASQSTGSLVEHDNSLKGYIGSLRYAPLEDHEQLLKMSATAISNQQSFTVTAPYTLSSVNINYYSDMACLALQSVYTTSGSAVTLNAGTYYTSNASSYYVCSNFAGGCSGMFSAATSASPTLKSISITYNFPNGSSLSTPCMYNYNYGYEAIANYANAESPVACTSSAQCGYSQSYTNNAVVGPIVSNFNNLSFSCLTNESLNVNVTCWGTGILGNITSYNALVPTLSVQSSNIANFTTISNDSNLNCAIVESANNINNPIYCWGSGGSGQIGNGNTASNMSIPTLATMPSNVTSFNRISTNNSFNCAIASGGTNAGKVYCWGTGGSGQIGNGGTSNVTVPTSVTMPGGVSAFSAVSTNSNFSCAIASSGTNAGKVYCWGIGTSGQIGNESTATVRVPTSVTMPSGVTAFSAVSTNTNFSCAIASAPESKAGIPYCWGIGTSGQIGNESTANATVPTSVTMPSGVTAFNTISTNSNFSCAIASAPESKVGIPYCWGAGGSGQIGNNSTANALVPTSVTMPSGVTAFNTISTNSNFSCAIASAPESKAGTSYCWGLGSSGQIGNGSTATVRVPTSVTMPSGTAFSAVSTNGNFSCAVASSGTNVGTVYCWGLGASGQIGNGGTANALVPTAVTMPGSVTAFSTVLTNTSFSCAIASAPANAAGDVYCWGSGMNGQLGNGISSLQNTQANIIMPANVTSFNSVSTNSSFSCGVAGSGSNSGKIYCWGNAGSGQIGNSSNVSVNLPTSVTMPSGVSAFNTVSTNNNFSCAISSAPESKAGIPYCWGTGTSGQIGNGGTTNVSVPTSVTMPSGVSAFNTVSTNNNFSCAIASTPESKAGIPYCWGLGASGQIGNGGTTNVSVPTSVTMPSGVTAFNKISTNTNFSCAIASAPESKAGILYCWGTGTSGQIGNGGTTNVSVPTSVTMPSGVTAFNKISTNTNFSCAIASAPTNVAGKVYCWGQGNVGQIGNGGTANALVPTASTMPTGVTSFSIISSNTAFSCALANIGVNAGKIYCWGFGGLGQIGNGANGTTTTPTAVTLPSGVSGFGNVFTNSTFSCAIASSGTNAGKTYCWGGGTSGQIGNSNYVNVNVPTLAPSP